MRKWAGNLSAPVLAVVLILLVNFLPPDTSLREVEANDAFRACVPTTYPPLVTGDPDRPGIDIEILQAVADDIGVDLLISPNDAMGRDFNPRNWAINRGKCQILAGGVVDSPLTRSFLDTGPPYATTGWALIAPTPLGDIEGLTIGVLTAISGLDRIGLSSYLRGQNVSVRILRSGKDLIDGISSGALDGGITEALLAQSLAAGSEWSVAFLPEDLARYNLVFGLWKGDLTLKRKIVEAFGRLQSDGTLPAILERYGAAPLEQGGTGSAM
jgi:ABC-type amino acid transport substrate-binding protein